MKTHLTHLYAKLGVNDRAAAVAVAYDRGILGQVHRCLNWLEQASSPPIGSTFPKFDVIHGGASRSGDG